MGERAPIRQCLCSTICPSAINSAGRAPNRWPEIRTSWPPKSSPRWLRCSTDRFRRKFFCCSRTTAIICCSSEHSILAVGTGRPRRDSKGGVPDVKGKCAAASIADVLSSSMRMVLRESRPGLFCESRLAGVGYRSFELDDYSVECIGAGDD